MIEHLNKFENIENVPSGMLKRNTGELEKNNLQERQRRLRQD
tara:strand:- start:588 stop:713 length:126 start_codon:yes stop_codon:yes gene_type:complete